MKAQWIAVGAALAVMAGVGASAAQADEGSFFNDADYKALGRVDSKNGGVIAAGNREAAEAGMKILDAGGNAVDAAAATLFAVGVAQFESCGIGGGGFMVYRSADGQVVDTIDFREWSPQTYEFSDWAKVGPTHDVAAWGTGHNVVGIPGAVAGMDLAIRKHGSKPWEDVLQPAIDLATDGFTVSQASQAATLHPRTPFFPTTFAIYGDADELYEKREKMRNRLLADDMLELQRLGPRAFYDPFLLGGTIAADLLVEMNRPSPYSDQATWEVSDLTEYKAISRPAVRTSYRSSEYIGMGAPSSAGPAIAQVLNILQGYDVAAMGQSSADQVHLFAEAMKLAWRDRANYLGDPDLPFSPTPEFARPTGFQTYEDLLNYLASKEYAKVLRAQIDPDTAQAFGGASPAEAGTNTHNIAVIDKAGNAVALNCSIEQPLGSSVTAAGTGFPLNSQLTDFEPPEERFKPETAPKGPGHWKEEQKDERLEGQGGPANGWAPRKRPRSSMAPSIVVRKGVPVLVTGGIGGPSIIGATAAAVVNVVDFGQDVAHAIDAERADPRGSCPDPQPEKEGDEMPPRVQLCMETTRFGRFHPGVLEELRSRGHAVTISRTWWSPCFGDFEEGGCEYGPQPLTHSAGINPVSGLREAASDPRAFAGAVGTASQESRARTLNPGDLTALAAVSQDPPASR